MYFELPFDKYYLFYQKILIKLSQEIIQNVFVFLIMFAHIFKNKYDPNLKKFLLQKSCLIFFLLF